MKPEVFDVRQPDGVVTRALEWRQGEIPCVLLHGLGDTADVWEDVVQALPPEYGTVGLDFRGHGDSGWDPGGNYALSQHVEDVVSTMGSRSVSAAVLVGHSLGGDVALRVAMSLPARVLGMVIVDVNIEGSAATESHVRGVLARRSRPFATVREYEAFLEQTRPLASPESLRRLAAATLRCGPDGKFEAKGDPAVVATAEDTKIDWSDLRQIRCPVNQ